MFQTKVWTARQGIGLNKFSIGGAAPVTLVNVPDQVIIPGDAFSEAVIKYIRKRHNVLIGDRTAEELK